MIFLELFGTFFLIGLFTFGGGYAMIPLIESQVVGHGWASEADITNFIAISESTPGPLAINMATFVGTNQAGFLGGACATLGVILPSFIIILLLATILAKFANNKYLKGAIDGNKPIIIALITSTVVFLIPKLFFTPATSGEFTFNRGTFALLIILMSFVLLYKKVFKKNLNTIVLLIISAIAGIIVF